MELEHLLCLNGCPVPVERRTMDFEDFNHCCDGDKDDEDFVLVDLKAGAQVTWLQKFIQKHLKVNNKFWRERHGELPLVQEMRKAIDTSKRGLHKKTNKRTGVIVGIKVRDKVVLVQHTKGLVLAAYAGQEKEAIRWFLEEIENDVKLLGPRPQQPDSQVDDDDPVQVIIDTVLLEIRGHPQCHKANFAPSRGCFQIIRKKTPQVNDTKCIYMKKFTKIRDEFLERIALEEGEERQDDRAAEAIRKVCEQALVNCTQYLELAMDSSSSARVHPGA
jgi:hypothetical protein